MLPGEPPKQDGGVRSLIGSECALHRSMEMGGLIEPGNLAQAGALGFQTLLDFGVVLNGYEMSCHTFLRQCAIW